ncbi:glycerate kinase [Sphingomonas suaedae]|uniref:Glycerate kinase n=1 Tax=Sphingomonas suaedae TaxID=2599297 RepID=A0A518RIQ1_9SPHN|nr:glycerate kinase [Sphingomonas suaedae]QDX27346.1 glycerate kinase [Sphingomonas suaedae]
MAVASDRVTPDALLRTLFDVAVSSAQPDRCVPQALPEPPLGRTVVIGAGKAAAAMARAVERNWHAPLSGLVVTRHGHGVPCERIVVREAGHPVPDAAGIAATREMVALLDGLTADDLVLCLISGGGSALLAAPPPGVSLADLQSVSNRLLRSGAAIGEMNCVRKHLSMVAGGRLAEHVAPARLVTLAVSDVPGDDPAMIASGPTIADPTTRHEALAVLARFGIEAPAAIRDWLESARSETPKSGTLPDAEYRLIASPSLALEAAAEAARAAGVTPHVLGSDLEGEARDMGAAHAARALGAQRAGGLPCVLLSGGETSVTVRGTGRGGRNGEYLLALTHALDGARGIYALAADTDGIDGTEHNAGAITGPGTIAAAGRSCAEALANSDSYPFFAAADALVVTGPTFTNVNDFRAILVDAPGGKGGYSK